MRATVSTIFGPFGPPKPLQASDLLWHDAVVMNFGIINSLNLMPSVLDVKTAYVMLVTKHRNDWQVNIYGRSEHFVKIMFYQQDNAA